MFVHLASDPLVDPEQEWQWLASLEESVTEAVAEAWAGEVEGVDLIGQEWVLSAHGPSVDTLWAAMSEVLAHWHLPAHSYALHRPAAGAPERELVLEEVLEAPPVSPAGRVETSTWRPLTEQGLLAALATATMAGSA